jgi:hypothetical protein
VIHSGSDDTHRTCGREDVHIVLFGQREAPISDFRIHLRELSEQFKIRE